MILAGALSFFAIGLLIGSFLNVVAIRVLKGISISFPPSHCVHCNHRLHIQDLIPVISYLSLRGSCRYCRQRISFRYPLGEFATGVLFAIAFLVIGYEKELVAALFFFSILVVITQTDLEQMLIPNRVVLAGVIGAVIIRLWTHPYPLWNHFAAFFAGSGLLLLLAVIWGKWLKREAMGGGDIKLYAFIGLILGIELTMLSIFAASLIGLLFSVPQILRKQATTDTVIPFGPYIAAGASITYLWGEQALAWYLRLI